MKESEDRENHEFWDDIILNDDGTPNMEAIYNELQDFRFLAQQAVAVYNHVTCSKMSKPGYYAQDIIAESDACLQSLINEEMVNVLLDIQDGTITIEDALAEYQLSKQEVEDG